MSEEVTDPFEAYRERQRYIDSLYAMSEDDFGRLTTRQQNQILFTLLKEQSGEIRDTADALRQVRQFVEKYSSEEGMKTLIDSATKSFMDKFGFGKLGF